MRCPKCSSGASTVTNSRDKDGERTRRRVCGVCGHRFNTVEVASEDLRRIRLKANAPQTHKTALRGIIEQIEGIIGK